MGIGSSSVNYYPTTGSQEVQYPDILDLVLKRVKLYLFKLIYTQDVWSDELSRKRFILADFQSGDEVAIRRSIETYFNTNATFPFTAYNIGDEEPVDYKSHLQSTGSVYVPEFGAGLSAIPYKITLPMVTFFNTPSDWRRINTIFALDYAIVTRLWVPCYFNGVLTQFPIDVSYEIDNGSYAFRYDEYLKTGSIYDITHNMQIYYHKFVLSQPSQVSGTGKQEPMAIYPVDNIEVALKELNDRNSLDNPINYSLGIYTVPHTPYIVSSVPEANAVDVSKNSPVILTFNVAMNESVIINNIDIIPYAETIKSLSSDGKVLTITPTTEFASSTQYEIFVNKSISADGQYMESSYSLFFTTMA